ncbi:MAG TPA: hypothetical protein VIX17_28975 [Pyrinomonadaceae bacterium]|jgi:hypothetical protein
MNRTLNLLIVTVITVTLISIQITGQREEFWVSSVPRPVRVESG